MAASARVRRADRRILFWAYLAIPIQYYLIARGWYGFFVRRGSPSESISRLTRELAAITALPEMKIKYDEMAIDPVMLTGDEVTRYLKAETARWRKIAQDAGMKPE